MLVERKKGGGTALRYFYRSPEGKAGLRDEGKIFTFEMMIFKKKGIYGRKFNDTNLQFSLIKSK